RLGEGQQAVEVLGADQRARELHREREAAILLVGPGADQGEAFDRLALGGDGLAPGRRQLAAFVAPAATRRGQPRGQEQRGRCRAPPRGARAFPSLHEASIPLDRKQYGAPARRATTRGGRGAQPSPAVPAPASSTPSPAASSPSPSPSPLPLPIEPSTRSMACRRSPSPRRIRVTPWVFRPTTEISAARVRTRVPPSEISSTSSSSPSSTAATSGPLRPVVWMPMPPWVPRPLRGNSDRRVRLP